MITMEEKIAIAKEIGMEKWVGETEIKLEMERQAELLTSLKFKETNIDEIKKKICRKTYLHYSSNESKEKLSFWDKFRSFPISPWIYTRFPLETMNLEDWNENIPYGGLLAVKEAKKIGLTDFQIHFPTTFEKARLKEDPVITGFMGRKKKRFSYKSIKECPPMHRIEIGKHSHMEIIRPGTMFEIFAWDDGKVYE